MLFGHRKIKFIGRAIFILACFVFFLLPYTISTTKNLIIDIEAAIPENISSLISDINSNRLEYDLKKLSYNTELTNLAELRLEDMREKKYIDHVNPLGHDINYFVSKVNYHYSYIGENLVINHKNNQAMINAWLASPLHRANLLSPNYSELGIAQGIVWENNEEKFVTVLILGQEKGLSIKNLFVK